MCWQLRRAEDERSAQDSKIAKLEGRLKSETETADEKLRRSEQARNWAEYKYEQLKKDADWKLKCGPFHERERKAYYELKELCSSQHINLREDLDKAVAQFNEQRDRADELERIQYAPGIVPSNQSSGTDWLPQSRKIPGFAKR
jgi:hypothetical protein